MLNFHCEQQTIKRTNERKKLVEWSFSTESISISIIGRYKYNMPKSEGKQKESFPFDESFFFVHLWLAIFGLIVLSMCVYIVHRLYIIVLIVWAPKARLLSPLKSNSMDTAWHMRFTIQRLAGVMNEGMGRKSRIFMGHCVYNIGLCIPSAFILSMFILFSWVLIRNGCELWMCVCIISHFSLFFSGFFLSVWVSHKSIDFLLGSSTHTHRRILWNSCLAF